PTTAARSRAARHRISLESIAPRVRTLDSPVTRFASMRLAAVNGMRKRFHCLALASLVACSNPHATSDGAIGETSNTATNHPNIVFILTDDLNVEVYGHMPRLKQLLDNQGTSFHNHFLNISLCCPSRTAILRGQYAHNTQIFSNAPPTGGFETFFANG